MKEAIITLAKYSMSFTGDNGQEVKFDYVDVEFAPNLFVRFKLTPNNERALARYNPDLYQLVKNMPYGSVCPFVEYHPAERKSSKRETTITDIYSNSENEL